MDYFQILPEALGKGAKIPLEILPRPEDVFQELAVEMVRTIEAQAAQGKPAVLIVPVGPVGHYPAFVRLVNERRNSLRHCWFINMDEYLDESGAWIAEAHPLSFRRTMTQMVYSQIDPALLMPPEQRIFPEPAHPEKIAALIRRFGGVDLCIGGIGINGHLAFNEPEPELSADAFAALPARRLAMAPETRAVNAAGSLGGALAAMPHECVTVGMADILSAKKIRLGCFREWHRGVVRQAAYGEVSASFPVTLLQRHPDAKILLPRSVGEKPW